jgi:hypothetical protein
MSATNILAPTCTNWPLGTRKSPQVEYRSSGEEPMLSMTRSNTWPLAFNVATKSPRALNTDYFSKYYLYCRVGLIAYLCFLNFSVATSNHTARTRSAVLRSRQAHWCRWFGPGYECAAGRFRDNVLPLVLRRSLVRDVPTQSRQS